MSAIHINKHNYRQEVQEADQPVLLDFWAPWCAPCRMVVPVLDEIARENHHIKVGTINVDEEPELASRYRVFSIPTLVVVQDGREINRAVGARPKQAILELL